MTLSFCLFFFFLDVCCCGCGERTGKDTVQRSEKCVLSLSFHGFGQTHLRHQATKPSLGITNQFYHLLSWRKKETPFQKKRNTTSSDRLHHSIWYQVIVSLHLDHIELYLHHSTEIMLS